MSIVTRFPPSPTGMMHIGTARTALFNWLFARHHGGKMLFRIEDTDRARHSEEAVVAIVNGLKWLELDYDGEIVSQFSMMARHAQVAHDLLKAGKAYECYCSPEELEAMREQAKLEGKPTFYDRRWRDSKETPPAGVKPVIRIKAPLEGASTINDHVQGEVTVQNDHLDDFIILRSDGTPVYMLSVVVDDHDMGVTHVVRGDDHLNNTFRQNIIYDALGWKKPEYAHMPLILGPDGSKMSKRHGAASVEEYRDMGYLPEAMRNYLLRLGWSHGDDEIISTEQAIEWFGLDHVHKSPARFDFAKLESLNAHYMKHATDRRLLEQSAQFFKSHYNIVLDENSEKPVLAAMVELKDRSKTLIQFADEALFLVRKPAVFEEKAWQQFNDEGRAALLKIRETFDALPSFTAEAIEASCRELAEQMGGKLGKIMMPLRAAVTGKAASMSVFHACAILGKDEISARIQFAYDCSAK